jgi:hypothetical protein
MNQTVVRSQIRCASIPTVINIKMKYNNPIILTFIAIFTPVDYIFRPLQSAYQNGHARVCCIIKHNQKKNKNKKKKTNQKNQNRDFSFYQICCNKGNVLCTFVSTIVKFLFALCHWIHGFADRLLTSYHSVTTLSFLKVINHTEASFATTRKFSFREGQALPCPYQTSISLCCKLNLGWDLNTIAVSFEHNSC